MKDISEIKKLRYLLALVVLFEVLSCAGAFVSCEPAAENPDPLDVEYDKFEKLCVRLCSPYPSHIIGRPIPGRLSSDTKCLCASNPPRIVAKWGY